MHTHDPLISTRPWGSALVVSAKMPPNLVGLRSEPPWRPKRRRPRFLVTEDPRTPIPMYCDEYGICSAVLWGSLVELQNCRGLLNSDTPARNRPRLEKTQQDEISWIKGAPALLTFEFVCTALGLDPEAVRERMLGSPSGRVYAQPRDSKRTRDPQHRRPPYLEPSDLCLLVYDVLCSLPARISHRDIRRGVQSRPASMTLKTYNGQLFNIMARLVRAGLYRKDTELFPGVMHHHRVRVTYQRLVPIDEFVVRCRRILRRRRTLPPAQAHHGYHVLGRGRVSLA